MKYQLFYILILSILTNALSSQESIALQFGDYHVEVDPLVGGRIIHFKYKGDELLTQPDDHPSMYGSTLWPSPQSLWSWPPPEPLDIGRYTAEMHADTIILWSEMDIHLGLQFSKIIYPAENHGALVIDYQVKSFKAEAIETALWEVTRCPGGITFFPYGERMAILDSISNLKQFKNAGNAIWYNYTTEDFSARKKLFSTAKEGWIAHQVGDVLFIKVYQDISPEQLPPRHGEVGLGIEENGNYIELENNSAYITLQTGDSFPYRVVWTTLPVSGSDLKIGDEKLLRRIRDLVTDLQATYFAR